MWDLWDFRKGAIDEMLFLFLTSVSSEQKHFDTL